MSGIVPGFRRRTPVQPDANAYSCAKSNPTSSPGTRRCAATYIVATRFSRLNDPGRLHDPQKQKKPRPLAKGTAASLDVWNSRATMRAAMPGSWDYRRRVRKPASSHLVGFIFASGIGQGAGPGALFSNSGQYNRSVLNPAIRVAAREVAVLGLPTESNI